MTRPTLLKRMETGVSNLDTLLAGGLPKGAITVFSGPPGSGKTILAQQICFHNAASDRRVLYFSTLSEPTAKNLLYLSQFNYFDAKKLEKEIRFVDLGGILNKKGLEAAIDLVMEQVKKVKPALVVIDSFKVFDDLARSREELRKFGYELAVHLMAWECTAIFLGEYGPADWDTNPLFSILDGLVHITHREQSGEQQRILQVIKMRGTDHSRDAHVFTISKTGVELFAPRLSIRRAPVTSAPAPPCLTSVSRLDQLLGGGIPSGSSLLVSGVAGTGKTLLLLEYIYRGAHERGEKGILFSFEETAERLLATARALGWEIDREVSEGRVKVVFIPQPEILVDAHLLAVRDEVQAFSAKRVAIDSLSVFFHKVEPALLREKVFQLASVVANAHATGLFATDIPYGSSQISRYGVEETIVDGVILLSSSAEGLDRERYIEVYKLRNAPHLKGRHNLTIGPGGLRIFPRYGGLELGKTPMPSVATDKRLPSGMPGLDELLGGGLYERSVTLVSGSTGIGKSTLAAQFLLAGSERDEPGVYVTLEEGPDQIRRACAALGLPIERAIESNLEIIYLSREDIRAEQLPAIIDEKVQKRHARRLVLDSATQLESAGLEPNRLRLLLQGLVGHLKEREVTTMITLETKALFSTDSVTDVGLSPVADNLLMLRYARDGGELVHTLTVVKTRGSAHAGATHRFEIGAGGARVTGPIEPSR